MKKLSQERIRTIDNRVQVLVSDAMVRLGLKPKKQLVWIDLETTGVDKYDDYILEVACVITNEKFEIIEEKEWVIKRDVELMKMISDDFVIQMHDKTGLWDKLENGLPQEQVDTELFEMIRRAQPEYKVSIGGNSVHFDLGFLSHHFEQTSEILSHRVLDISAVLKFLKTIGKEVELPEHTVSHNALDDIRWTITQAQTIKEYLK